MNIKWIIKDGTNKIECASFPFAFRTMYNIAKKGVEGGRKFDDMTRGMSITGPIASGAKSHTYSYAASILKAQDMGLLTPDGMINGREFKRS